MDPQEEKVLKLAAEKLGDWIKFYQVCQLRLRCAEIVYTTGSQQNKNHLDTEATKLYVFALGGGNPEQVLQKFGISDKLDRK